MNKIKYNHAFDLAFSLETFNDAENVTIEEAKAALLARIEELDRDQLWAEAVGASFDTYEVEEEEAQP